jgi:hypothetical protein
VSPVGGVAHLAQAVVADGEVGRDRGGALDRRALARDDDEARRRRGAGRAPLELGDRRHPRGRAAPRRQRGGEGVEGVGVADRLDRHPEDVVAHPAREGVRRASR